jgi:hypothetical protein
LELLSGSVDNAWAEDDVSSVDVLAAIKEQFIRKERGTKRFLFFVAHPPVKTTLLICGGSIQPMMNSLEDKAVALRKIYQSVVLG